MLLALYTSRYPNIACILETQLMRPLCVANMHTTRRQCLTHFDSYIAPYVNSPGSRISLHNQDYQNHRDSNPEYALPLKHLPPRHGCILPGLDRNQPLSEIPHAVPGIRNRPPPPNIQRLATFLIPNREHAHLHALPSLPPGSPMHGVIHYQRVSYRNDLPSYGFAEVGNVGVDGSQCIHESLVHSRLFVYCLERKEDGAFKEWIGGVGKGR